MAAVVVMQCSNPVFMLIGSWKGRKNLRVEIFLSYKLLGSGYRKQTIFSGLKTGDLPKQFFFVCGCD